MSGLGDGPSAPGPPATVVPLGPATRTDGWAWLLLAVGGFVLGQVAALVIVGLVAGIKGKSGQLAVIETMASPPEWYVVSSLVGIWCGFGVAPLLASRLRGTGRPVADLGLRFRWIDVLGIAYGVGGQVLVSVLYAPFINHLHNFSAPTTKLTGSAHGWGFFVISLLTVVGAPFFEELSFRGLLLRALVRLFTPVRVTARPRTRPLGWSRPWPSTPSCSARRTASSSSSPGSPSSAPSWPASRTALAGRA